MVNMENTGIRVEAMEVMEEVIKVMVMDNSKLFKDITFVMSLLSIYLFLNCPIHESIL
jgi:hypothetical protein